MRRRPLWMTIAGAAFVWFAMAVPASACPMCKLASESSSRLPRAYMYSILFMMGMPAVVTAGFGIGFYRLSRKAAQMQREALEALSDEDSTNSLRDAEPMNLPDGDALRR